MDSEIKTTEHNGVYDYKVTMSISIDYFDKKDPKYLISFTEHGVTIKPYYGEEKDRQI